MLLRHMSMGVLAAALAQPAFAADHDAAGDAALLARAQALFKPLPANVGDAQHPPTPARVALGRALFFDPRLSEDGTVSCARCHAPALYGTDALRLPIGDQHRVNPRNAPTVLNAALNFVQHWRGDRVDVEDQARRALTGPPSFGLHDEAQAAARLHAIPGYAAPFHAAFPGEKDPINAANFGIAVGAYERTLLTPSPFDAFLKGDAGALSPQARAGLAKFMDDGCAACHNGVGIGGGLYQKFGLVEDYWKATGSTAIDKGRFDVTHAAADMYVFKVPSLRNVAMTPPYFHDGSVATLPQAIRVMARVQLGRSLSDLDVADIQAFLGSLTGPLPKAFAEAPVLPASPMPGAPASPAAAPPPPAARAGTR